jgi:hypothetical protein
MLVPDKSGFGFGGACGEGDLDASFSAAENRTTPTKMVPRSNVVESTDLGWESGCGRGRGWSSLEVGGRLGRRKGKMFQVEIPGFSFFATIVSGV